MESTQVPSPGRIVILVMPDGQTYDGEPRAAAVVTFVSPADGSLNLRAFGAHGDVAFFTGVQDAATVAAATGADRNVPHWEWPLVATPASVAPA